MTDPQEGAKLRHSQLHPQESRPCLGARQCEPYTTYTQGKSVQEIAQELSISRTTVRKYLNHPEAVIKKPRPPRPSKLDSFKDQITKWVTED
ncbi:MAG TPA: LuxR C-terminal-related transcriptional regulator, partial [Ktedonobacteraceae bacterium]|nr:LuxR C-terminal-related transcriptional regulator [Ktedonobacteraceae bacterium]